MNKLINLFLALLCLAGTCQHTMAQKEPSFEEQVAAVTQYLNFDDLHTGILYQRAVEYVPLHLLNGRTHTDSARTNAGHLRYAYAMLQTAHVGGPALPRTLDAYWNQSESMEEAPHVYLGGLLFRYDRIREDAIDSGLMYVSDDKLYDVPYRSENPYLVDTVWITAPYRSIWEGLQVPFASKSAFWLSNVALDTTALLIDYDTGNGWEPLYITSDTTVAYAQAGDKIIRLGYVIAPGDTLECRSLLKVKESGVSTMHDPAGLRNQGYPVQRDDKIFIGSVGQCVIESEWYYDEEEDFGWWEPIAWEDCLLAGVEVSVFYNRKCGDHAIRKPLIIIEGFDPNNSIDERFLFDGEYNSGNILVGPPLLGQTYEDPAEIRLQDHLHDSDYDVFFINFKDSRLGIATNAAYVMDAIREINRLKSEAGSSERNVIIGASMGGVVGKAALRQMELAEEDHETELFISFDSPLKGAYIPVALQAMLYHTANYEIAGKTLYERDRSIAKQYYALFSQAALDMLYYHVSHCNSGTCTGSQLSVSHDAFYAWFEGLGNLTTCEEISISNGAIEGTPVDSGPGSELFSFIESGSMQGPIFEGWVGSFEFQYTGHALPAGGDDFLVLHSHMTHHFFWVSNTTVEKELKVTDVLPYDFAPGGMREFYTSGPDNVPISGLTESNYRAFCFIPTISSLALNVTDPYYPSVNLTDVLSVIEGNLTYLAAYTGPIEESTWYGEVETVSQPHITLDRMHVRHLLSRIGERPGSGTLLTDKTFNFGNSSLAEIDPLNATISATSGSINKSLEISGSGALWLNRLNRIAFIDNSENPYTQTNSLFQVHVIRDACNEDPVIVTVENGGKLQIGEEGGQSELNTGYLHVHKGNKLHIKNKGTVTLEKDSRINVKDGANIEIESGGLLNAQWGSQVILDKGAEMRVQSGGTLRISQYSSLLIEPGATLILEDGAIVQLWDGHHPYGNARIVVKGELHVADQIDFSGNGFFDFFNGHSLSLPSGQFTLIGMQKDTRMIRLQSGAQLNADGTKFTFKNGLIEYLNSSSLITVTNQGQLNTDEVTFKNEANAYMAIEAYYYDKISINSSDFLGFEETALWAEAPISNNYWHTRVTDCKFIDNDNGIFLVDIDQAYITGCYFTSQFSGSTGVLLYNVDQLSILDAHFEHLHSGIKVLKSLSVGRVVISNSVLQNNSFGVLCGSEQSSLNLIARQGTVFENNGTAIHIATGWISPNSLDYGLVKLDCAALINNDIGIKGKDLLLQIDAFLNSHPDPQYTRRNRFECDDTNGQLLFDLCFIYRSISHIEPILARGNYWDHPTQMPYLIRQGCSNVATTNLIDRSLPVLEIPQNCPSGPINEETDPKTECALTTPTQNVRSLYREFYDEWLTKVISQEYDTTHLWFEKLEAIVTISPDLSSLSNACRHLILESRTFRNEPFLPLEANPEALILLDPSEENQISMYPNPFNGQINISGLSGNIDIIIRDVLGRTVYHRESIGDSQLIETWNWKSGI